MLNKSRTIVFSGLGAAVVVGGLVLSTTLAKAQTPTTPFSGLAEAIAKKFNLDQAQVQTVFDEYHDQRRSEMFTQMKERQDKRLSQLVSDGKLTETQKQAVLAKMEELAKQRESDQDLFKNMTAEERRTEMEKRRDVLESWAEAQGIDPDVLTPRMGMMGKGMMGHRGMWDDDDNN